MSIHLNGLQPVETEKGVAFSADVNGRSVECIITFGALSLIAQGQRVSALKTFCRNWATIRDVAFERLQSGKQGSIGKLALVARDFIKKPKSRWLKLQGT